MRNAGCSCFFWRGQTLTPQAMQSNMLRITSKENLYFTGPVLMGFNILVCDFERSLGHGTYAVVFGGIQNGNKVAVKIARPGKSVYNTVLKKEIETMKKLKHPNIVCVLDSFITTATSDYNVSYLTAYSMPRMQVARMMMPLKTDDQVTGIALDMFGALSYLESKGICHNDPKPANILWNGNNFVLSDFGLASKVESKNDWTVVRQTRYYSAPENIIRSHRDKETADVWAMALTVMEAVTGHVVFREDTITLMLFVIHLLLGIPKYMLEQSSLDNIRVVCVQELSDKAAARKEELTTDIEEVVEYHRTAAEKIGPRSVKTLEILYNHCIVVDPEQRDSATDILSRLEELREGAE